MENVSHMIAPVYDHQSKILILGTIPSPKSREYGFYYGHPQNRFWKLMAALFDREPFTGKEEKIDFLLRHHIALWDVLQNCEINGADDASIQNPVVNDLSLITGTAPVRAVFTTGKKADALYKRFCRDSTGIDSVCLPSTSPANCAWSWEALLEAYQVILTFLD